MIRLTTLAGNALWINPARILTMQREEPNERARTRAPYTCIIYEYSATIPTQEISNRVTQTPEEIASQILAYHQSLKGVTE